MKFTLSWLREHLDTTASLETLCATLTAIGLEVESVTDPGAALKPFIIARVRSAEKHPQADRLKVCEVETGSGPALQVVCGAPNCRAGLKVVLARPGDVMPDTGEALKKGTIRGVESQGMMCAADELKLGEETQGIIELPEDAPVGAPYAVWAGWDDPVIEINLTPNRGDAAGVRGVARDLAAAGLGTLKPLKAEPVPGKEAPRVRVTLDFPEGRKNECAVFAGRVIRNLRNGASPEWVQRRLRAIGLRPLSALVDVTNIITFDNARPLHVFDVGKLKGDLRVAPAKGGERFAALNGETYTLQEGMTAISDASGVVSLAGVMGGVATGCDSATTDVFIESAWFDPVRVARTGRALKLSSDACYRFERGVDPASTLPGLEAATRLILDLCGTPETVVGEVVVAGAVPSRNDTIALDPARIARRLGLSIPVAEQERILQTLGFALTKKSEGYEVRPPSWRPDVKLEADLSEEILRLYGYDHLPVAPLPRGASNGAASSGALRDTPERRAETARRALAGQGLMEAVTWSFMSSTVAALFGGGAESLKLLNPISADLDAMRPSVLGNLALAAQRNADRGFPDVGLFEVGPVWKDATPEGQLAVACALRAGSTPRHWAVPSRPVDAFDAKADALAALAALGAPTGSLTVTTDAPGWYHPGRSGCLRLGPALLAHFGELHPALAGKIGAAGPLVGCEIFLAALPSPRNPGTAKPLLKKEALQPVTRDFAFLVDREVSAERLVKAVRGADKALIRDVAVFDVYEGEKAGAGKKSVALGVMIQPSDKSLTEAELDALGTRITAAVTKATGAVLRG